MLSSSSEIKWTCQKCANINHCYISPENNSLLTSKEYFQCVKCGEQKPNASNMRQFHYVENSSMMLGARIEAKYHGGEIYYPGVIKRITKTGLYEVEYDDGEIEYDVHEDSIIVVGIYCGTF